MSDENKKNPFLLGKTSGQGTLFGGTPARNPAQLTKEDPMLFGSTLFGSQMDCPNSSGVKTTSTLDSSLQSTSSTLTPSTDSGNSSMFGASPFDGGFAEPVFKSPSLFSSNPFSTSNAPTTNKQTVDGNNPSSSFAFGKFAGPTKSIFGGDLVKPSSNTVFGQQSGHETGSFGVEGQAQKVFGGFKSGDLRNKSKNISIFGEKPVPSFKINTNETDKTKMKISEPSFQMPDKSSNFSKSPSDNASIFSKSSVNIHSLFGSSENEQISTSKPLFDKSKESSKSLSNPILPGSLKPLVSQSTDENVSDQPQSSTLSDSIQITNDNNSIFPSLESILSDSQSPVTKKLPSYLEKAEPTVIIVANLPKNCLDKNILKRHFSKFGTVVRVSLHTSANQAQVTFSSHEAATIAKKKGKKLHPNLPDLMIFFGMSARPKHEDTRTDLTAQKKVNAAKTFRQNSSENRGKKTLFSVSETVSRDLPSPKNDKSRSKWLKSTADMTSTKRDYRNIPTDLNSVSKLKTSSGRSSPMVSNEVVVDNFTQLLQTKATTNQEKYNLLNARDKLIRKLQTKVYDVHKATYLSAKCKDMCPEKERYMREVQFDLSPYEMTDDRKVIHERAVKKFSRSSADKDEPLPYELRTGPVLIMTTDFLLCNILPKMDEGVTSDLDVCYNYLWDRTRAMRSDITQQHLVDLSSVYVLERCVRFHLYASERLCTEPSDIFSPKLNTEHIQKSMQTLKELYYDLSQNNVYCDNEAEFRSYEILLNVYDGSIMFSFMNFRKSIQSSAEVKFAVEVLNSIQTSNYVRFFKLAKKASFLQACIMHRYFNTVRVTAISTFVKSFGSIQFMTVEEIVNLFGFDSTKDAVDFLSHHNLKFDASGLKVLIGRKAFNPSVVAPSFRAVKILYPNSQKENITMIINGGTIPKNPLDKYEVHSSFSRDGYLVSTTDLLSEDSNDDVASDRGSEKTKDLVGTPSQNQEDKSAKTEYDEREKEDKQADTEEIDCLKGKENVDYNVKGNENYENEQYEEENQIYEDGEYGEEENEDYEGEEYGGNENYEGEEYENYDDEENENYECEENDNLVKENADYEGKENEYHEVEEKEDYEGEENENVFSKKFQNLIYFLTRKSSFENVTDWRQYDQSSNFSDILQDLYEFKLSENAFIKWKFYVRVKLPSKRARTKVLSRRVLNRWRVFVDKQKYKRLMKSLRDHVRDSLRVITVKTMAERWRFATRVSKTSRKLRERRQSRLARKYYGLWLMNIKKREWARKSLTVGFPAAPSRLTVSEQNELWNFNCGPNRSFLEIQNIEKSLERQKAKFEVRRSLTERICCSPLPLVTTFKDVVCSKEVPYTSKPRSYIAAVIFETSLDKNVLDWIRKKLGIKPTPKGLQNSFNVQSSVNNYSFEFIECKESNLKLIAKLSAIYFVTDKTTTKTIMHFNAKGIMTQLINFKIRREDCIVPKTSLNIMEKIKSSYMRFGSHDGIISGDLIYVAQTFISKHVLHQFSAYEELSGEFNLSCLPPNGYSSLMNKVVKDLKLILNNYSMLDQCWIDGSTSQVNEMNQSRFEDINTSLETLVLSELVCTHVKSWSDAVSCILDYVLNNITYTMQFNQLSSEVIWCVNSAKQDYILQHDLEDYNDELPDVLLLPWRKIYSALVSYKLCQIPSVCLIYCVEQIGSYKTQASWYDPFLMNIKPQTIPSKRKLVQDNSSMKKHKPDEEFWLNISAEKAHIKDLEGKLTMLVEGLEFDSVFGNSEKENYEDDFLINDETDLRSSIAKEKKCLDQLENRLNRLTE